MKKDKKALILTIIGVLTLISVILGATYAYFVSQYETGDSSNITVSTSTTDALTFSAGSPITLNVTPDNFKQAGTNVSGGTTASAVLVANNHTNEATMNYYVYLNITKNEIVYTTTEKTPELILKVTDPNNQIITSIPGLTYDSTLQGFDITEKGGLINIVSNYEIKATPTITHNWKIEVIMVNLDSDQESNANKNFTSVVLIQKEEYVPTFADYIQSTHVSNAPGQTLLYHDAALTNGAGDLSYRYSGASNVVNNFVCFGTNAETCPYDNLYRIIGIFDDDKDGMYNVKLIKYDYVTSTHLGTNGGYIYSNSSSSLPYDTYIGNQITIGMYYWKSNIVETNETTNIWSESGLNTINLNTNYINYLTNTWSSKIAETTWKVGGGLTTHLMFAPPLTAYSYEIGANSFETTYNAKIGLMYVSDYGYAANQESWTLPLYASTGDNYSTITKNNWLYMGIHEWTISRTIDTKYFAFVFLVSYKGHIDGESYTANSRIQHSARPVFYLNSNVTLQSGTGTYSDPYRV